MKNKKQKKEKERKKRKRKNKKKRKKKEKKRKKKENSLWTLKGLKNVTVKFATLPIAMDIRPRISDSKILKSRQKQITNYQ